MLFNSLPFFVFLAVVLVLYYSLAQRWQNAMLLLASYVFYGWWNWRFLSLLMISTAVDFVCAQQMHHTEDEQRRRRFLLASVCTNLGILGFFKYFNFFVASFATAMDSLGMHASMPALQIILPVGISFYTFQTMAYTIDVYRGRETPTKDLLSFALYVSFFPQLVAGPIERSTSLLPQLRSRRHVNRHALETGCSLMLMGYFKKVFIADGVAPYVDQAFANPAGFDSLHLLLSLYLFAIQIYGDFSGYTDIARGVSRLLGIELALNFRQPYFSTNITEFWRRWHISLSSWLRDYLYIPLGGNRAGKISTYRNLMLTMLLGGLWHGAAWTFVVWGGLHGLYLAVHRMLRGEKRREPGAPPRTVLACATYMAKAALTFNLVCLAWIFFRADTFADAWSYLLALGANWHSLPFTLAGTAAFYLTATVLIDLPCWVHGEQLPVRPGWPAWWRGLNYATMLVLISFVGAPGARPFIYFQF